MCVFICMYYMYVLQFIHTRVQITYVDNDLYQVTACVCNRLCLCVQVITLDHMIQNNRSHDLSTATHCLIAVLIR